MSLRTFALAGLQCAMLACGPGPGDSDSDTEDTSVVASVPVVFYAYDEERQCWLRVTEELDATWWQAWVDAEECTDAHVFTADLTGRCISFPGQCTDPMPADPWLSDCGAFPDCCTPDRTTLYPLCP